MARIVHHLSNALETIADAPDVLFESHAVVKFIFTSLPPESQCILLRMSMISDPCRWEPLLLWFKGAPQMRNQSLRNALGACRRLRLILVQNSSSITSSQTNKSSVSKYEVHPQFLRTLRRKKQDQGVSGYKWLKCTLGAGDENLKNISHPDAGSLETFSRQKWGGVLLWAFKETCTLESSPVLKYFPISSVPPPGEILRSVLLSKGLIKPRAGVRQSSANSPYPATSSTAEVRWFLSDLTTQVDQVVIGAMHHLNHDSDLKPLLVLLAHICANKIGEPLFINTTDAPPKIQSFLTTLHDLGFIYQVPLSNALNAVYPCPLARVFLITNSSAEVWALSQLFGAECLSSQATKVKHLPLPRQRYSVLALPQTDNYLDPPPDRNFEFSWDRPSDPLKDYTADGRASEEKQKGILVEPNFRVFCYYPDALQASVIASICDVKIITPVLMVAMLTRESVVKRLAEGLKAEQIIKFLSSHAHPLITSKLINAGAGRQHQKSGQQDDDAPRMAVPENVLNQLLLWEDQLNAISCVAAALFELTDVSELSIFPQLVYRAKTANMLLFSTPCNFDELQDWKEAAMEKMKMGAQSNFQMKFGQDNNMYPNSPVVVVKAEYKDEFVKIIKTLQLHTISKLK